MQISVAPKSTASRTRARELLLGVLVGVRRALALPEAAERAADDADVGDVDVAVDDERHGVARQLGAQLVGGGAHVLDRLRAASRRTAPSAPRATAPRRRGRLAIARADEVGLDRRTAPRCGPSRARGMKRPVLRLDDVEHALGRPTPGRCTARRRTAARSARRRRPARRLRTWCGDGNGCSGEMWSPLALSPPRSVAPAATSSGHQSARFGGTWMPTPGSSSRAVADQLAACPRSRPAARAHAGRPRLRLLAEPGRASSARAASSAISAGSSP